MLTQVTTMQLQSQQLGAKFALLVTEKEDALAALTREKTEHLVTSKVLNAKVSNLQETVKMYEKDNKSKERAIHDHSQRLIQALTNLRTSRDSQQEKDDAVRDLTTKLAEMKKEKNRYERWCRDLLDELEGLRKVAEINSNEVGALTRKLSSSERANTKLKEERDAMKAKLKLLEEEAKTLRSENTALKKRKGDLDRVKRDRDQVVSELEEARGQIKHLTSELSKTRTQGAAKHEELLRVRLELAQFLASLRHIQPIQQGTIVEADEEEELPRLRKRARS